MNLTTQRQKMLGQLPKIYEISNRINYLSAKNTSLNKNLLTYIKKIQKIAYSQRFKADFSGQQKKRLSLERKQSSFKISQRNYNKNMSFQNTLKQKENKSKILQNTIYKNVKQNDNKSKVNIKSRIHQPTRRVIQEKNDCQQNKFIPIQYLNNNEQLIFNKFKHLSGISRMKYQMNTKKDTLTSKQIKTSNKHKITSVNCQTKSLNKKYQSTINPKNNNFFNYQMENTHYNLENTQFNLQDKQNDDNNAKNSKNKQNHNRITPETGKITSQQAFKLIKLKKQLLDQQQKTLEEYQKCILHKQKMVQRIKLQKQAYNRANAH